MSSTIESGLKNTQPPVWTRMEYKWIALSVTTIGSMMAAIDSTIVILGLPKMMLDLHADLIEMIWVIMAYILVSILLFSRSVRLYAALPEMRLPSSCSALSRAAEPP